MEKLKTENLKTENLLRVKRAGTGGKSDEGMQIFGAMNYLLQNKIVKKENQLSSIHIIQIELSVTFVSYYFLVIVIIDTTLH